MAKQVAIPTEVDEAKAMVALGMAWLKEHAPDQLKREDGMPLSQDERKLRRMLASRSGFPHLYMDDGEANGECLGVFIDFMRDSVDSIEAKLADSTMARYKKLLEGISNGT